MFVALSAGYEVNKGDQEHEDALVNSLLSFGSDSEESHCMLFAAEPSVNLQITSDKCFLQVVHGCWLARRIQQP